MAGRKPSVRYWSSRGGYCCWFRGKQRLLAAGPDDSPTGPTYLAALDEFRKLLHLGGVESAAGQNTLAIICEHYLTHVHESLAPQTYKTHAHHLNLWCNALSGNGVLFGDYLVERLTPFTVQQFLREAKAGRGWENGTVRVCLISMQAALNWAVRQKLIAANPLDELKSPRPAGRGHEPIITEADHQALLDLLSRSRYAARYAIWRDYLAVLKETGARPGEIANVSAADFQPNRRAIVYPPNPAPGRFRHKTARLDKTRIIRLRGEALEVIERRAQEYPSGPLFGKRVPRHAQLRPWNAILIAAVFRGWAKKLGLPHLRANGYRHTFATRWLMEGRSIEVLAQLLGNSSDVIRRTYSHLASQQDYLDLELDGFRASEYGGRRPTNSPGAAAEPGESEEREGGQEG